MLFEQQRKIIAVARGGVDGVLPVLGEQMHGDKQDGHDHRHAQIGDGLSKSSYPSACFGPGDGALVCSSLRERASFTADQRRAKTSKTLQQALQQGQWEKVALMHHATIRGE